MLGFVLRFVCLWGLALLALSLAPGVERWMVETTTAHLAFLLRSTSVDTHLEASNVIRARGAYVEIVPDCTALMPTAILWAAVIAFPAPPRPKLWGVALGSVAVWVFNLVRMLALVAVLWWSPQNFEFVHVYLWRTGTLLVVCAMFILWVRLGTRDRSRP